MASDTMKLYPSGFMGSSLLKQTEPLDIVSTAKMLFNNNTIKRSNPYTASVEVEELWAIATSDDAQYHTFEYKERILKCALKAFGQERIIDWIDDQYNNPQTNSHHYKWIDETLEYVYGSVKREFSFNNWCLMLKAGDGNVAKFKHSDVIKAYLFNGSVLVNRSRQTMSKFILQWVRQPGGIDDLLSSLNVLYGKR